MLRSNRSSLFDPALPCQNLWDGFLLQSLFNCYKLVTFVTACIITILRALVKQFWKILYFQYLSPVFKKKIPNENVIFTKLKCIFLLFYPLSLNFKAARYCIKAYFRPVFRFSGMKKAKKMLPTGTIFTSRQHFIHFCNNLKQPGKRHFSSMVRRSRCESSPGAGVCRLSAGRLYG